MFTNRNRDSGVGIKRPTANSTLGSEFDDFLYAPIGEINDDMPFSVLSALARQNVDPWEEAAKLALLPRDSAIVRLTSVIFSVDAEPSTQPGAATNGARLVALLPRSARFTIPKYDESSDRPTRNYTPIIIYIIVGALIFVSALLDN